MSFAETPGCTPCNLREGLAITPLQRAPSRPKENCNGVTGASRMHRHGFLHALIYYEEEAMPLPRPGTPSRLRDHVPSRLSRQGFQDLPGPWPRLLEPMLRSTLWSSSLGHPSGALAEHGGRGGPEGTTGGGATEHSTSPHSLHQPPGLQTSFPHGSRALRRSSGRLLPCRPLPN